MPSRFQRLVEVLKASQGTTSLSLSEIDGLLDQPLPPSARKYGAWWSVSREHSTLWVLAGFHATPKLKEGRVEFKRIGPETTSSSSAAPGNKWDVGKHLAALDVDFTGYLEFFETQRIFSGPSVYFYDEVVKMVRSASEIHALASNDRFAELMYAALTSWGMHRMGAKVATKLTEFPKFRDGIGALLTGASHLRGFRITDPDSSEDAGVNAALSTLVASPGLSASSAPLVANAKALHFILPDLVPPIDRRYTGRFFYGPNAGMNLPSGSEGARKVFGEVFPRLRRLARDHREDIGRRSELAYLCQGEAKVLDNAIIGYMLKRYPGKKHEGGEA